MTHKLDREHYVNDPEYRRIWGVGYLTTAAFNDPQKLIVGANGRAPDGWVMSDSEYLDITKKEDWERFYRDGVIDEILAEHVIEHLTQPQALAAFGCFYRFLKPGGHVTISVPDGGHPDQRYINAVKPGGTGHEAEDHKMLWSLHTLRVDLEAARFRVVPIEYWQNPGGIFHRAAKCGARKHLTRTWDNDPRAKTFNEVRYTSLIVQAFKE